MCSEGLALFFFIYIKIQEPDAASYPSLHGDVSKMSLLWDGEHALRETKHNTKSREIGEVISFSMRQGMSKEHCHLIKSVLSNYSDTI